VILVAGLGNPGPRYEGTRHNAGFLVVEEVWRRAGASMAWREQHHGLVARTEIAGQSILLLKPQTLMNRSGVSVRSLASFYRLAPTELVAIHDELDLPLGQIRLKVGGGDAGHNGLRSISSHLGSQDFVRLRFGIGRPPAEFGGDTASYVLQAFAPPERAILEELVGKAAEAIHLVVSVGIDAAMNQVNRRCKD
jgi:PTH1 family peptidyl-tRNA hydrolase